MCRQSQCLSQLPKALVRKDPPMVKMAPCRYPLTPVHDPPSTSLKLLAIRH